MRHLALALVLSLLYTEAFALSPVDFTKTETYGEAQNLRHKKDDVDLSIMKTDLGYDDLSPQNAKELESLFETKKEFGKVFGFKDWTPKDHKLVEVNSERVLLLYGNYVNNLNQKVNFMEVYWANKTISGQYLLTSDTKEINFNNYKEYLK
jgi:hypothetical protein